MERFNFLICWKVGENTYMSVENNEIEVSKYLANLLSVADDVSEVEIINQRKGGLVDFK